VYSLSRFQRLLPILWRYYLTLSSFSYFLYISSLSSPTFLLPHRFSLSLLHFIPFLLGLSLQISSPSPGRRLEGPPGLGLYILVSRPSTQPFDFNLAFAQNTLYIQVIGQDNLSYLVSSDVHELKKLGILVWLDKFDVLQGKVHRRGARQESATDTGAVFELDGDGLARRRRHVHQETYQLHRVR
jgi:hypothetical protein